MASCAVVVPASVHLPSARCNCGGAGLSFILTWPKVCLSLRAYSPVCTQEKFGADSGFWSVRETWDVDVSLSAEGNRSGRKVCVAEMGLVDKVEKVAGQEKCNATR